MRDWRLRIWGFVLMSAPLFLSAQRVHRMSPAAQEVPVWKYVDPFIGTTESDVITRWGNEGGAYPGAVAVSGFMQLSPETRPPSSGGYNYKDHSIYLFSCTGHHSGFPSGSSGRLYVMPLAQGRNAPVSDTAHGNAPVGDTAHGNAPVGDTAHGNASQGAVLLPRPFSHAEEQAEPGYYRVRLSDDGTVVEAVATTRAGVFRIHFPPGATPRIFIGEPGKNAAFNFNETPSHIQQTEGGRIYTFQNTNSAHSILIKISASTVSAESAQKNIGEECSLPFDTLRVHAREQWAKALSVARVDDDDRRNKTIFYTALYHSLLVPWIISDVDGDYRGADGKIYRVTGRDEYGEFSPWDSFRSLHPLLSLLFPDKESEMVRSMLDVYVQGGYLPVESMTGNHAIPIIVDSYLKGIQGIDKRLAYEAMSKSIVKGPFIQGDMAVYRQLGYIPFEHPESVTRTLEYAYDDWALGQFAGKVMGDDAVRSALEQASLAYRHLFYPPALLMLPREGEVFKPRPGNSGYKEGDAWVYSYFVPQDPAGLIHIMGGGPLFARRLDSALGDGRILFDNETVLQIPYLFNEAGFSPLTQRWVKAFMMDRYQAIPGGLPGNDDLGAMSSWYVLSALGFFPTCPGRPQYEIGSPVFHSVTLRLANGKRLVIQAEHPDSTNIYIQSLSVNGVPYRKASILHSVLTNGGRIVFDMGPAPGPALLREKSVSPSFRLSDVSIASKTGERINVNKTVTPGDRSNLAKTVTPGDRSNVAKTVAPGDPFNLTFSLRNTGAEGTMQVLLRADGKIVGSKNCLVAGGREVRDSIACRLYRTGDVQLRLGDAPAVTIHVIKPDRPMPAAPELTGLQVQPVIREGDSAWVHFTVLNTGWETKAFRLPLRVDGAEVCADTILLEPGQERTWSQGLGIKKTGIHDLDIGDKEQAFKVYGTPGEASVFKLSFDKKNTSTWMTDRSGFYNQVRVIGTPIDKQDTALLLGRDRYLQIVGSPSLDRMGEKLTMMLWVYPQGPGRRGLVDIFTKGDNHVLQISGQRTLTFFAGGWGRGDCTVSLPADWSQHWHHIAGVCSPDGLSVYIDGQLKGYAPMEKGVNLSIDNNAWIIGRNDEFPGQRIYEGYINNPAIFQEALSAADISAIYQAEGRSLQTP